MSGNFALSRPYCQGLTLRYLQSSLCLWLSQSGTSLPLSFPVWTKNLIDRSDWIRCRSSLKARRAQTKPGRWWTLGRQLDLRRKLLSQDLGLLAGTSPVPCPCLLLACWNQGMSTREKSCELNFAKWCHLTCRWKHAIIAHISDGKQRLFHVGTCGCFAELTLQFLARASHLLRRHRLAASRP